MSLVKRLFCLLIDVRRSFFSQEILYDGKKVWFGNLAFLRESLDEAHTPPSDILFLVLGMAGTL
jgi:hypothetical protein